jgi:hypothetical protein
MIRFARVIFANLLPREVGITRFSRDVVAISTVSRTSDLSREQGNLVTSPWRTASNGIFSHTLNKLLGPNGAAVTSKFGILVW